MVRISKEELISYLKQLDSNPKDTDLINLIAIGYFQVPELNDNYQDYNYFKKAYETKKTIKSINNFSWFLYFEWSEIEWRLNTNNGQERAIEIQKEAIELNPVSYIPYYLLGYMLLDQNKPKEALIHLKMAELKSDRLDIKHNISICYAKMGEYEKSLAYLEKIPLEKDHEYESIFDKAKINILLGQIDKVNEIIKILISKIDYEDSNYHVDELQLAELCFEIGDFKLASQIIEDYGFTSFGINDWKNLGYSLNQIKPELYNKITDNEIREYKTWINEIENNHEDWSEYSPKENLESINDYNQEIEIREKRKIEFKKPVTNLKEELLPTYCYCLMFDCRLHENQFDDNKKTVYNNS